MRIACITTSVIPSKSANSIQAMKVVHAFRTLGHDIRLWVPDFGRADWQQIAEIYGLRNEFEINWLPFLKAAKRYDFCWKSVRSAARWKADVVYTWSLQAAPGHSTPRSVRRSRLFDSTDWTNDVPVLGAPMCRTTRVTPGTLGQIDPYSAMGLRLYGRTCSSVSCLLGSLRERVLT